MVFNTPSGGEARGDGYEIRAAATSIGIPCITTVAEFNAAVQAIEAMRTYEWSVTSLQEHAAALAASQKTEPEGNRSRPGPRSDASSLTLPQTARPAGSPSAPGSAGHGRPRSAVRRASTRTRRCCSAGA